MPLTPGGVSLRTLAISRFGVLLRRCTMSEVQRKMPCTHRRASLDLLLHLGAEFSVNGETGDFVADRSWLYLP